MMRDCDMHLARQDRRWVRKYRLLGARASRDVCDMRETRRGTQRALYVPVKIFEENVGKGATHQERCPRPSGRNEEKLEDPPHGLLLDASHVENAPEGVPLSTLRIMSGAGWFAMCDNATLPEHGDDYARFE